MGEVTNQIAIVLAVLVACFAGPAAALFVLITPSLPMIEPLNDSFFAWLMKVRMLKPAYMAVLKGRV